MRVPRGPRPLRVGWPPKPPAVLGGCAAPWQWLPLTLGPEVSAWPEQQNVLEFPGIKEEPANLEAEDEEPGEICCQGVAEPSQLRSATERRSPAREPGARTVHKEGNLARTVEIEPICKASRSGLSNWLAKGESLKAGNDRM
jgi:hypothetical protein